MDKKLAGIKLHERVGQLIGSDLAEVEKVFQEELASKNPYVNDVYTHVSRFRGKRLRPILVLLSAEATGGIRSSHHVLSAVVEMIHTATLVHDDILDEAETRRHVATVNSRWNNETSVLFGDFLFTHAFHLASSLETTYACRLIGEATNLVCEGELSQIRERGNLELSEEAYFQIIDGKTAELCALCCHLGAYYTDSDQETVNQLSQFGRLLGTAFQIADDLLDLQGDEKETGKSLGTDLEKQKMTLPLIRLLSQSDDESSSRILKLLNQPSPETRTEIQKLISESDAVEYSMKKALEIAAQARTCLNSLNPSPAKQLLEDLSDFATQRSS